jgi:hypothetical protein
MTHVTHKVSILTKKGLSLSFITLLVFYVCCGINACSIKPDNIQPPTPTPKSDTAGTTLNGEISVTSTRVFIGDSAGNPYKYLWGLTNEKSLGLFLAQDLNAGTNTAMVYTPLKIQPDGKCSFSATVPSWFDGDRDFVAGFIDYYSYSVSSPGQFNCTQYGIINPQGQAYLPMFFPLTKSSGYSVKAVFQTLGSMLAIRLANNTGRNYTINNFQRTYGMGTITGSGIAAFSLTDISEGAMPIWIGSAGFTSFTFSPSYTFLPQTKDTLYIWMKQNSSALPSPVAFFIENSDYYGVLVEKQEPSSGWLNNAFYGFPMEVNYYDVPEWTKCYGGSFYGVSGGNDVATSVREISDGYIVAGYTNSKDGDVTDNHTTNENADVWVLKLDINGNILWKKCYGGSGSETEPTILPTNDGGYIMAARSSTLSGDNSGDVHSTYNVSAGTDIWVVKLNSNGDTSWTRCYGGLAGDDLKYGDSRSIIETGDGYIVCGYTSSNSGDMPNTASFYINGFLLKIDTDGNIKWVKTYGGANDNRLCNVQPTQDGYIAIGFSTSSVGDVSSNKGGYDFWIVNMDKNGIINWKKSYGGSGNDFAMTGQQTKDGGYIVGGMTASTNGDVVGNHGGTYDAWILKLNSTGDIVWKKCYGGSKDDQISSIRQTDDGGYIAAGTSNSTDGDMRLCYGQFSNYDYWVMKIDADGNILWNKRFGGTSADNAYALELTSDGGHIVVGSAASYNYNVVGAHDLSFNPDYWILKFTPPNN